MNKEFQRRVEDFDCEHCGVHVRGDGYTNHCPECLWSKHVDVNPGDRAATCRGIMEPIEVVRSGNDYILIHTCTTCGYVKKNKLARNDNMKTVVKLAHEIANK